MYFAVYLPNSSPNYNSQRRDKTLHCFIPQRFLFSLHKPQDRGLVISEWQDFSPSLFQMAWERGQQILWNSSDKPLMLSDILGVWLLGSVGNVKRIKSCPILADPHWDAARILMRSDEPQVDTHSAKCRSRKTQSHKGLDTAIYLLCPTLKPRVRQKGPGADIWGCQEPSRLTPNFVIPQLLSDSFFPILYSW